MSDNQVNMPAPETSPLESKFGGDVNKLQEAYLNLERELGSRSGVSAPEESPKPAETSNTPNESIMTSFGEGITGAVTTAGLDLNSIQEEFNSDTGLSQETRSKLDGIFGADVMSTYLRGVEATKDQSTQQADAVSNAVLEAVGGSDNWNKVSEWAGKNNPDLTNAFNAALDTGDVSVITAIAGSLKNAFESSKGSLSSSSVKQGIASNTSSAAQAYSSNYEMSQDIRNPEYQHNPAFREQVAARIKATTFG